MPLTRKPTAEEVKEIQRRVAESIRTDWEKYDQRYYIVVGKEDEELGMNAAIAVMQFDEDKNPVCGATACIAGRAEIVGLSMDLVVRPTRDTTDPYSIWENSLSRAIYSSDGFKNTEIAADAWELLGLKEDERDIFHQNFDCLTSDEGDVYDSRENRRLNAYRVARMIDEIAEGRTDATDPDVRCRPIELPPEVETPVSL